MRSAQADIVVAGHICLDIIPTIGERGEDAGDLVVPGVLVEIGPAVLSTGGPVSNTGQALHRLGVRTRLMGKIGDDLFGEAILGVLRRLDPALAEGMLVAPGVASSYTLVISPPGIDRSFLHCAGANAVFGAADIPYDELVGARVFHFGYPPLMRRMYADGGAELAGVFRQVKERGPVTSLDMCHIDPSGEAGQVDWRSILQRVLPDVDIFLPSLGETLYALRATDRDPGSEITGPELSAVADELLAMDAGVVGLKLGDRGLYIRTPDSPERLAGLRELVGEAFDTWVGRELYTPCFVADVVGTTGCGDCTIGGFLTGLLHRMSLDQAVTAAVGVGACNVEQPDSTSGVPSWQAVQARIDGGWAKRAADLWPGWTWDASGSLARGPRDRLGGKV